MIAIGITLAAAGIGVGKARARTIAFPVLFFLAAVPWPTIIEAQFIQSLTRWNASVSAEIVQLLGIPALQHGNLIEVSRGLVGIDEACSGIRSLQASLMLGLFFGDYFRLRFTRRLWLCAAGFLFSIVFNIVRTSVLVTIAAKQGVPAMAKWHDPAGAAILIGCFMAVWAVSMRLREGEQMKPVQRASQSDSLSEFFAEVSPALNRWMLLTLALLVAGEVFVEKWYSNRERLSGNPKTWLAVFPTNNPSFQAAPLPSRTHQLLRHDAEMNAHWLESDGTLWFGIFLQWKPGRTASCMARSHTPELCLPATGGKLSLSEEEVVRASGLAIPVQFHRLEQGGRVAHVLYSLWSDQSGEQTVRSQGLTYVARMTAVHDGQRMRGQRSLELAVWGEADPAKARVMLIDRFKEMITLESAQKEMNR